MTAPLPLPDDPRLPKLIEAWPQYRDANESERYLRSYWPRSVWLHDFEAILREHYPQASSDELTLTARLAAPFPLARPGVP